MLTVILIIHVLIAVALIGVVLMQKSEGGALGIGGGGGGGFMSIRGTANLLTRATAGLAAAFFVTSITLALMGGIQRRPASIIDTPAAPASGSQPAPAPAPAVPSVPRSQ